jgi:hypothetical protein
VILLYPLGLFFALACAWAGRWIAFWLCYAMAAGATLFAYFYTALVEVGSHGSVNGNDMAAMAMALVAPWMAMGLLAAAALSFALGTWGDQSREARERTGYDARENDRK